MLSYRLKKKRSPDVYKRQDQKQQLEKCNTNQFKKLQWKPDLVLHVYKILSI